MVGWLEFDVLFSTNTAISEMNLNYEDCLEDKRENLSELFHTVVCDSCVQWYTHKREHF